MWSHDRKQNLLLKLINVLSLTKKHIVALPACNGNKSNIIIGYHLILPPQCSTILLLVKIIIILVKKTMLIIHVCI